MKTLDILVALLLVVGGLNWGLWGLFQFDLVAAVFGGGAAAVARVVYILVGLALSIRRSSGSRFSAAGAEPAEQRNPPRAGQARVSHDRERPDRKIRLFLFAAAARTP